MKKSTAIFTVILSIFAMGVFADVVEGNLIKKLNASIEANNALETAQWAQALRDYRQSQFAAEAVETQKAMNTTIGIYKNIFKSVPVILKSSEDLMNIFGVSKHAEERDMLNIAKTLWIMTERPLAEEETKKLVKQIKTNEEKREVEWRKRYEK